ncbi:carboxymuconolactone decarboxylase family protein [Tepidibacillus fermentans]|uniref:AhpD family alkylhydroperoxidase n=1 Tax=Tepidibacillus fermentans TaxID=1281767 RepID=A0A4R3KGY9_9BACI|nr:carboxymuconolactone decarboxylase family protein [Tepidibacillus fermentans]TCS82520.1 AhpD family alkylhydroperoxidase [Tepidibacillus fermentans]
MEQKFYKKIYSVQEFYVILYKGLRTIKYMIKSKKSKELTPDFIERIMLAVTEVNGCEVCTYGHTKMALEQGMSNEEVQMLLSGITDGIPNEEVKAILFAQHYADSRGNPTVDSWKRIVEAYGTTKALGILGAIRAIMIGNAYGIALSAFRSRLRGKPIQKSNLLYEISMILSIMVFLPVAFIHGLISDILRIPIIRVE